MPTTQGETPEAVITTERAKELIESTLELLDNLKTDLDTRASSERVGLRAHQDDFDRCTQEVERLEAETNRLRNEMREKRATRDKLETGLRTLQDDLRNLGAEIRTLTDSQISEDLEKLSNKIDERLEKAETEEERNRLFQEAEQYLRNTERDFSATEKLLRDMRSQRERERAGLNSTEEQVAASEKKLALLNRLEEAVRQASGKEDMADGFERRLSGIIEQTAETQHRVEELYLDFHKQLFQVVSEYAGKASDQRSDTTSVQQALSDKTHPIGGALLSLKDALVMEKPEEERISALERVLKELTEKLDDEGMDIPNFDAQISDLESRTRALPEKARDAFEAFNPERQAEAIIPPSFPETTAESAQAKETADRLRTELEEARRARAEADMQTEAARTRAETLRIELDEARTIRVSLDAEITRLRRGADLAETARQKSSVEMIRLGNERAEKDKLIEEKDSELEELRRRVEELEKVKATAAPPPLPAETTMVDQRPYGQVDTGTITGATSRSNIIRKSTGLPPTELESSPLPDEPEPPPAPEGPPRRPRLFGRTGGRGK